MRFRLRILAGHTSKTQHRGQLHPGNILTIRTRRAWHTPCHTRPCGLGVEA